MLLQGVTKPQGQTVRDVAIAHMQAAGFRAVSGDRTTINGLDAFVGVYQGQIEGLGEVASRAAHIAHGGAYYLVAGLVSPAGFDSVDGAFTTAIRSFRPLTAAEAQAIRPSRMDFYVVREGDSWPRSPSDPAARSKPSTLAVMNHSLPDTAPRVGCAHQDRGDGMTRYPISRILRIAAGAGAVAFGVLSYMYLTLPDVRPIATTNPKTTAFIELREREASAAGRPVKRAQRWVPYSRISMNLRRAVLAAEDSAFFEHEGIDIAEIRKSIQTSIERGESLRGASTITQQLAKNLYLSPSRDPLRKVRELMITWRLETALSKARILEIYLNVIEWGDRRVGRRGGGAHVLRHTGLCAVT